PLVALPTPSVWMRTPRLVAWSTLSGGAGKWLFCPSHRETIDADECWPNKYAGTVAVGRGVVPGPCGCCHWRIELGRSDSLPLDSSIASSDTRIARPIAVARCARSRLIAAITRVLSVVGA